MSSLKNTISKISPYFVVSLVVFIITHLVLFNINTAEWGDSYRILRSAEELRMGNAYPEDEKRPPLLSIVISTRPDFIDPVSYGRTILFVFSLLSFLLFNEILKEYVAEDKYRLLGLLLFTFNPTYLYWSIRIMADVPFAFMCLLGFYILIKKRQYTNLQSLVLGLISGLSILLRFEGYILSAALGLGLVFSTIGDLKVLFKNPVAFIKSNLAKSLIFFFGLFSFLIPFILYRNPFTSSYFEEPSGRKYDLRMVLIYIASLTYVFGFTGSYSFILGSIKSFTKSLSKYFGILVFVLLELLLILGWPAAIPRLFVCIIPLLILSLVVSIKSYFESEGYLKVTILQVSLVGLYVVTQYYLGLQFLVMTRKLILLIALLQLPVLYFVYKKKFKGFLWTTLLSAVVWSFLVIFMHKDIFISVKNGAEYITQKLTGKVCFNDVSSVSRWYLTYQSSEDVYGVYCDMDSGQRLTEQLLIDKGADHILLTNEHNLGLEIDFEKRSYLKVLKEFRYNVNGSEFVTYVASYIKE